MYFPLFIDLTDKPCLVVGDGCVARRKASALAAFGARVKVVAPETCGRGFETGDVEGMTLVVAATDDGAVNRRVADACKARGVPVNVVDDPANCTFVFPAIFRKDPIVAAVSSNGSCPVAARIVRDRIGTVVSDGFAAEAARLGARREELKKAYPDCHERAKICEEALLKWND